MQANPSLAFPVKALVFDAYGTLFDVHSVIALLEKLLGHSGGWSLRLANLLAQSHRANRR